MAPRKPGPVGHDSGGDAGSFVRDVASWVIGRKNPYCLPGPIDICISPRDLVSALAKPSAPPIVTSIDEIIFHVYMKLATDDRNFNVHQFENWFRGQLNPSDNMGPWDRIGIQINFHTDDRKAAADFQTSLENPSAAVVYWGHALQDENDVLHSMGLHIPFHSKSYMPSADLRQMLAKARAPLVIIASCDSKYAVTGEKPFMKASVKKRDGKVVSETSSASHKRYFIDAGPQPVVVVTDSGANLLTNSLDWAPALAVFFASIAGIRVDGDLNSGTLQLKEPTARAMNVTDALVACNKFMGTDSLVLGHGNGSFRIFAP